MKFCNAIKEDWPFMIHGAIVVLGIIVLAFEVALHVRGIFWLFGMCP